MIQNVESTYGSDQRGLVWGFRFAPDSPASPITSAAAADFLAAPKQGEFLWLHFSIANSACQPWLQKHLSLPEAFYESLRGDAGSTRLELDLDSLVAHIHDVLFDFTFDASAVATTVLCIKRGIMVSARLRPLRSIDQLREAVRAHHVFRSPVDLLSHLLHDQANVLVDIVRKSTTRVDQIEDRLLENRISKQRTELGALRRMLVRLQRLLAPEPAAFFRLLSQPPDWITREEHQDLQQAAEEFSTAVNDSATLIERVKLLQEELGAQVNEQTNRTLFILTFVTVLALPINMAAGLFGMNVGGIPMSENSYGFFWIAAPLLLLTAFLAYWGLGRNRD